jgi:hypothetical protein
MGQILLTPKINRKREVRYMAGKPDYNYCIQYQKSIEEKPKVFKLAGGDKKSVHRTVGAVIKETIGFQKVTDIWMETITGWEKHGEKLRYYDMEYFSKL